MAARGSSCGRRGEWGLCADHVSRFNHFNSFSLSSISSAAKLVRVSLSVRGPIRGKVGKGWFSTYASAMLIGQDVALARRAR